MNTKRSNDNRKGGRFMLERLARRVIGALKAGCARLGLGKVKDPRADQGKKWSLGKLLNPVVVGMCAGKHSLAQVELLSQDLSQATRKALGIWRHVPDTTMRDVLVKISPHSLVECLTRQTKDAHRQKALQPVGLPFGVVGVDGKTTCIESWEHGYAQRQVGSDRCARGMLRTMTCMLLSSQVPACIHVESIPPETNEDGLFQALVDRLLERYGEMDLFRMMVADAGSCSLGNADYLRQNSLPHSKAEAVSEESVRGGIERRTLFATTAMSGYHEWSHLAVVLRVRRQRWNALGQLEFDHERYFLTSLRYEALEPEQWLCLIRRYWASVESGAHQVLDTAFEEDARPWILNDDQGALNLLILRRIAFNLVARFRGRTLRSEENRDTPWKRVMEWFHDTLISATAEVVSGLRPRPEAVCEC
jgi:hypothetical protein